MKRLLVVIVTSAAVALLVLLPHGGERWIWVRLLIAAVLVWGVVRARGVWLDALLGGYIALLGAAVFMVTIHDPGAPRTTFEPRARLVLPNVVVAPTRQFEEQADVVLIVIEEKRGDLASPTTRRTASRLACGRTCRATASPRTSKSRSRGARMMKTCSSLRE